MGFKHVSNRELKRLYSPAFIGVALKEREFSVEAKKIEITNEELLYYHYDNKLKLQNLSGKGVISVINNSIKDQIWNAQLKLKGPQIINLNLNEKIYVENIEPNSKKNIFYDIISTEGIPDPLRIIEKTEISNIENDFIDNLEDNSTEIQKEKHLLIFGKENVLKFTITIENISTYEFKDIVFIKKFAEDFYDLKPSTEIKFKNRRLEWQIPKLMPEEKIQLIFHINIKPIKKDNIGTGNIELFGKISSSTKNILSGIEIEDFSAYSHARHAIRIKENKNEQDKWECTLSFKNNSEFEMKLNSILVLNEFRNKKILDLELDENVFPMDSFISEIWEVNCKTEPKFNRKLKYSVNYEVKNSGNVHLKIDQNHFDYVDIQFQKKFSESFLVQSARLKLEESLIENLIQVKNTGTIPIRAIIIKERIHEDFLIPIGSSKFKIRHSSGKFQSDNFYVKISPDDKTKSNFFILEISININQNRTKCLLDINEFLEIKYPIFIGSPNYKHEYKFPIEIISYISKYRDIEKKGNGNLYINKHTILSALQPSLRVGHFRQDLEIAKSIYPGQNTDEFEICLSINNSSTLPVKNINFIDVFPKSFEFISSNVENKTIDTYDDEAYKIAFNVESILPNKKIDIIYDIRNVSGKYIEYSELESFIFELGKQYSPALLEPFRGDKQSIEPKKIEIINEENLQFQYDNNGILKDLSGNGVITVKNNSTKDRVWNAQLKLSGSQLVNLNLEKDINLGMIKPETGKNVNYDIKSMLKIPNPLKITEETDIINIDTQEFKATASYLNARRTEKLLKKKKLEEKEVQDKIEEYLNNIKSSLGREQENLDEAIEMADKWASKESKLKETVNTLKIERNTLITAKSKALRTKLKKITGKIEFTKKVDIESSINEIRNQINAKKDDLIKLEEESSKKEASLKKKFEDKYDSQIKEKGNNLTNQEATLFEAKRILEELSVKSKDLNSSLKNLKKEYKTLIKTKSKALRKKLKEISRIKKDELKQSQNQTNEKKIQIEKEISIIEASAKEEIENNFNPKIEEVNEKLTNSELKLSKVLLKREEWRIKKEKLENIVKKLKNERMDLIIEKSKFLNRELSIITKEKNSIIKEIEAQISEKENSINKIKGTAANEDIIVKEIQNKFDQRINDVESKLNNNQRKLDDIIKNFNKWTTKKKVLMDNVKALNMEYNSLIKKSKTILSDSKLEIVSENEISNGAKKHTLILGMENILNFTIIIENISTYIFQNTKLVKEFSKEYYDFTSKTKVNFKNKELEWKIPILRPGEKKRLSFQIKIMPVKNEQIGTGNIELYGECISSTNKSLSGIEIEDFLSYSNALHTILVKKDEKQKEKKEYLLIFRNNSEFNMNLNSILVLDQTKNNRILDITSVNTLSPEKTYISETWDVENELYPKFFRKVNYSVAYEINNFSKLQMTIDPSFFDFIDIQYEREYSESFLVKSASLMLEESRVENLIRVRNIGTTQIDGIIIKEIIPIDFIPPSGKSKFQIKHSSVKVFSENYEIKITPPNKDPSFQHIIELFINLNEYMYENFMDSNEILEIKYPLSINSPNFLKKYSPQFEIILCFSKYNNIKSLKTEDFYYYKYNLSQDTQLLRVGHYRENLEINKFIYPGKNKDEYRICLNIKNISFIPATNINLIDTFTRDFEFISSNFSHNITEAFNKEEKTISFNITKILPNQEKEIEYYIRNISGIDIDYSDLEIYIYE